MSWLSRLTNAFRPSSVDGALGTGSSLIKTLSRGSHVITARVTDRRGRVTTVKVAITVE